MLLSLFTNERGFISQEDDALLNANDHHGISKKNARAAVVNLNFRAGSTFPVPVCTVPRSMDRTSRCTKVDAVRRYASYRSNLLLLKRQRCVNEINP